MLGGTCSFILTSTQSAAPAQRLFREHKPALFLTSAWYALKCLMRQLFVPRECNIYVYVCFIACMPELHMYAGPAEARRPDNSELELQMIVSWCVGAGNQTRVLCESKQCPAQGLIAQKTLVLGSFPSPDSPSFPFSCWLMCNGEVWPWSSVLDSLLLN